VLLYLQKKTNARLVKQGVSVTRPVATKVALPLIEFASLEDDNYLHTLWANLLASALDDKGDIIERKFISVLADLAPNDAQILAGIYNEWQFSSHRETFSIGDIKYGESVDGSASHNEISIITLNRLGLITPSYTEFKPYDESAFDKDFGIQLLNIDPIKAYGNLETITVTPFGEAFCKAVNLVESSNV